MKRIAILGASGYAGRELEQLISQHPSMQVDLLMSARANFEPEPPALPHDQEVQALDLDRLGEVDGVFLCTPHGTATHLAEAALAAGARVVDLSADFRLRDPRLYQQTYGLEHPAPELLGRAVYGLTEHHREEIRDSSLVANPGCYPTAILLPLLPLLRAGLLDEQAQIIADCKSGASGAGRAPTASNHFGAVHENFRAYAPGSHRHSPEIWKETGSERILFVPHLLPLARGIYSTLYVQPAHGVNAADLSQCLEEAYGTETFIRLYSRGLPELNRVQRSNYCDIAVVPAGEGVILISALDNLRKGASGQALQNMNLMLGIEEEEGLL